MIDLFIIAGFLGAGKTTFIEKWLAESEDSGLTVVIENDFGDVNMDAAYLANRNIEVKSLSSGCICCSLSKDFESAIRDIALRWQPSRIIVEPSGVAHLSDIEKACLPLIKAAKRKNNPCGCFYVPFVCRKFWWFLYRSSSRGVKSIFKPYAQ